MMKPTAPAAIQGMVVTLGGTHVDVSGFKPYSESDWTENRMMQAKTLVDGVRDESKRRGIEVDDPVMTFVPAQWFHSDMETYAYYASIMPGAAMHGELLHTKREHGHIAAIYVDLSKSNIVWDADKGIKGDAVKNAIEWAANMDLKEEDAPTPRRVLQSDPAERPKRDKNAWSAGLVGRGDFIGLYVDKSGKRPNLGLLVVRVGNFDKTVGVDVRKPFASGIVDPPVYSPIAPHTFGSFADLEWIEDAKTLAYRNAKRILYNALASMGLTKPVSGSSYPDAMAVPDASYVNVIGEMKTPLRGTNRRAVLAALTEMPFVVEPDIHCELDFLMRDKSPDGIDIVSLFDGVISVKRAIGGLMALESGKPETGMHIVDKDAYISVMGGSAASRSFDGGFVHGTREWKTPKWVRDASVYYGAEYVVVKK